MMNNSTEIGYYDIDLSAIMSSLDTVEEIFYIKNLKNRKLFISDEIDQYLVNDIVMHIMQYNADDKGLDIEDRKPIILYMVTRGGEFEAGLELIDVILNSKTPVYTVNLGYQYSMGFLIGLAGHKRYATSNARYLMHDGSSCIWDSGAKVQDRLEFNKCIDRRVRDYVVSRSNITYEEYDSKFRVEWYMFADEAKKNGFVDYIIGVDCDISEVI